MTSDCLRTLNIVSLHTKHFEAEISLMFSAGRQQVFTGGNMSYTEILYKKNIPLDGQTRSDKIILTAQVNLPGTQP